MHARKYRLYRYEKYLEEYYIDLRAFTIITAIHFNGSDGHKYGGKRSLSWMCGSLPILISIIDEFRELVSTKFDVSNGKLRIIFIIKFYDLFILGCGWISAFR